MLAHLYCLISILEKTEWVKEAAKGTQPCAWRQRLGQAHWTSAVTSQGSDTHIASEVSISLNYMAALVWLINQSLFDLISAKKSHLHDELSGEVNMVVVLTKWMAYLSLRISQDDLHVFASAPGVLVLPDEVGGRTGCDTRVCSPDLETKPGHQSTQNPYLHANDRNIMKGVELPVGLILKASDLCPSPRPAILAVSRRTYLGFSFLIW